MRGSIFVVGSMMITVVLITNCDRTVKDNQSANITNEGSTRTGAIVNGQQSIRDGGVETRDSGADDASGKSDQLDAAFSNRDRDILHRIMDHAQKKCVCAKENCCW
jgi:hypothetical protein